LLMILSIFANVNNCTIANTCQRSPNSPRSTILA